MLHIPGSQDSYLGLLYIKIEQDTQKGALIYF